MLDKVHRNLVPSDTLPAARGPPPRRPIHTPCEAAL